MIGIICAMPQEIRDIERSVTILEKHSFGGREFHIGSLNGKDIVLVLARIGKVAAATTTTTLLTEFNVSEVLLTGVAGGVGKEVHIGDIVVGSSFIQHDLDASASNMFKKFEVPLLGVTHIPADLRLVKAATNAAQKIASDLTKDSKIHVGLIGSGDQFIASKDKLLELRTSIPELLCVEMEGAACAQVCYEFQKPFVCVRTISDKADDNASVDFMSFVENIAAPISEEIAKGFVSNLV